VVEIVTGSTLSCEGGLYPAAAISARWTPMRAENRAGVAITDPKGNVQSLQ